MARPSKSNKEPISERRATGIRERRPSNKVAIQLREQEDRTQKQVEDDARRAERARKTQRARERAEGIDTRADEELVERPNIQITTATVTSKPATLVQRASRVPPPRCEDTGDSETRGRPSDRSFRQRNSPSLPPHPFNGSSNRRIPSLSCSPSPLPHQAELDFQTESRASSPSSGDKRTHSEVGSDLEVEQEMDAGLTKARKIHNYAGRPKAANYDDSAREVILKATACYRVLISTHEAFPDSATEIRIVKEAWKMANENSGMRAMAITPDINKIIKARGPQLRGEIKSKTAPLVEALYGFESGQSRQIIARNRKLAEELKYEKGFIYKAILIIILSDNSDTRKGMYAHPIIQKAVNAVWFKNKRDEGVTHTDKFSPLPVPAIALLLTAIECNIDEWVTGVKTDVFFYADEYRALYNGHIQSLETYGNVGKAHDLLGRLQRRLYNYGRHHAGAPSITFERTVPIPLSAFQAAVNEYEADSATDSEGEMISL